MNTANLTPALRMAESLAQSGKPAVLAIDGRCGSGKTALAALLAQSLPCRVVHLDDFYLPLARRDPDWQKQPGGNMDFARFRQEVLDPALRGEAVTYRPFRCQSGTLGEAVTLPPCPLTVAEGSYALHPALDRPYGGRIFLTCSRAVQERRLRAREGDHYASFEATWIPLEELYFRQCRPDRNALVLDTGALF